MLLGVGGAGEEKTVKRGSIPGSACWEGQGLQVNKGGHLHLLSQGQAQECLLEKSMLDNRKSFLVARISAQVGMG